MALPMNWIYSHSNDNIHRNDWKNYIRIALLFLDLFDFIMYPYFKRFISRVKIFTLRENMQH